MVNGTVTNPVNGKSANLGDIYFKYAKRFPWSPAVGSTSAGSSGLALAGSWEEQAVCLSYRF